MPDPGGPYSGTRRQAFLPDDKDGREVCAMLKVRKVPEMCEYPSKEVNKDVVGVCSRVSVRQGIPRVLRTLNSLLQCQQ